MVLCSQQPYNNKLHVLLALNMTGLFNKKLDLPPQAKRDYTVLIFIYFYKNQDGVWKGQVFNLLNKNVLNTLQSRMAQTLYSLPKIFQFLTGLSVYICPNDYSLPTFSQQDHPAGPFELQVEPLRPWFWLREMPEDLSDSLCY